MAPACVARPTLNPALKSFWMTPATGRVLYGGRISTKCLALGTRVVMEDYSLRAVEDVRVGNQVMGPDGLPRTVTSTTRGCAEMFRVHQSYGYDYVVNGDHVLSLKKQQGCVRDTGGTMPSGNLRRSRGRYPDYPEIVNLSVREYLAKSDRWRGKFAGYKAEAIEFPPDDPLPVDPYFIGLWLGEAGECRAALFDGRLHMV